MSLPQRVAKRLQLTWEVLSTGTLRGFDGREIPAITPQEIEEIKTFFPMTKFFITGHPRSGTTLMTRLIQLHPEVHCNYQGHFFTYTPTLSEVLNQKRFAKWMSSPKNRWNRGTDMSPVALRAMVDYIMERDARLAGKTIVGDKSPNMKTGGQAVEEMHVFYPDAIVINMVRDGRDVLVSHRFQTFIDKPHLVSRDELRIREDFAADPEPFLRGERSLFTEKRLIDKTEAWVQNVRETDAAGRRLYGENYHALRFEDLLREPFEALAPLWKQMGAEPLGLAEVVAKEMEVNPDEDWQRRAAGDLVSNLEKGKRGSWRELFTARDKKLFKELAGDFLIEWGFEQDLEW